MAGDMEFVVLALGITASFLGIVASSLKIIDFIHSKINHAAELRKQEVASILDSDVPAWVKTATVLSTPRVSSTFGPLVLPALTGIGAGLLVSSIISDE
ncbi:MAG: hypothetical protein AAFQ57_09575 [Cyanobacteria bacterium J06626_14]